MREVPKRRGRKESADIIGNSYNYVHSLGLEMKLILIELIYVTFLFAFSGL